MLARSMQRRHACAVLLAAGLVVPPAAGAQPGSAPSSGSLRISLEQRTRVETIADHYRPDDTGATRVLALRSRIRVQAGQPTGWLTAELEFQDARGLQTDAAFVDPADRVNELDVLQAALRLRTPTDTAGPRVALDVGRLTLDLGSRRLSARNGMRNTTNAFDGAVLRLDVSAGTVRAFLTRPVLVDTTKLDSSTKGGLFWGGLLRRGLGPRVTAEGYYLGLHDDASFGTARRQFSTAGGRLRVAPQPRVVDGEVEAVWQHGRLGHLDHAASFLHIQLGYTLDGAWSPRVSLHYDDASGDEDPQDERSGQFDTLFGTKTFELSPSGIYGPFARANLRSVGWRLSMQPLAALSLRLFHRGFWLEEARDTWVDAGWRDPSGESGRYLGQQIEVAGAWSFLPYLDLEAGVAHLFKGGYLDLAPASASRPDTTFAHVGWNLRVPPARP